MNNNSINHLFIITGEFPYLTRETFLETEILYLSKAFNKITILPTKIGGKEREVPQNVIIDNTYSKPFKRKFRKIRSLTSSIFLKGLIIHRKYLFNLSALRRINSFASDALITKEWFSRNIENAEYSTIYTYWLNGKTYGAELFSKQRKNLKVCSRAHRYDLYDSWFKPAFWPFRQQSLSRLQYLYLISDNGEKYLKEKYFLREGHYGVFKLGVEENNIVTSRSTNDHIKIVSVSGLIPVKRIDLLAKYLAIYCQSYSDQKIHWTHIGDGKSKTQILRYLDDNSTQNLTYDFKGQKKNTEVFDFYRNNEVDLFINISESEGLPVSIMEAQSCGILVAASNVGGVSEIVNENSGILLPENPGYDVIENLLSKLKIYLTQYSALKIKDFWSKNFNADNNYKNFSDHLRKLK